MHVFPSSLSLDLGVDFDDKISFGKLIKILLINGKFCKKRKYRKSGKPHLNGGLLELTSGRF